MQMFSKRLYEQSTKPKAKINTPGYSTANTAANVPDSVFKSGEQQPSEPEA
jgi:hypothetical protein